MRSVGNGSWVSDTRGSESGCRNSVNTSADERRNSQESTRGLITSELVNEEGRAGGGEEKKTRKNRIEPSSNWPHAQAPPHDGH